MKNNLNFKIVVVLVLVTLSGCKKNNPMEENFITSDDEYWATFSEKQFHGISYKFKKNGQYDKYLRFGDNYELFNNDGDDIDDYRLWSVSKDSILSFGAHKADVVLYNKNVIILSYGEFGYTFLVKVKKGMNINGQYYYETKRKQHPEKYKSLYDERNHH